MGSFWTDARIEELKERLKQESAGSIARSWGVTRNVVIGKTSRLRKKEPGSVPAVASTASYKPKAKPRSVPSVPLVPIERRENGEPISRELGILELTSKTCKFPTGGEKEHTTFCGHSVAAAPYCQYHAALCYPAVRARESAGG